MNGLEALSREQLVDLILSLRGEVAKLRQLVIEQQEVIAKQQEEIEKLRAEIEGKGPDNALPHFIKVNRKERREQDKQERKKRKQSFTRKRQEPTEEIHHAVDFCPDCGHRLTGGHEHSRRQQIEIPEVKIRVIDHVLISRYCGYCQKSHVPRLGEAQGVLGKHRFGARAMALIATLNVGCRVTIRGIQQLLKGVLNLEVSIGEISEILHEVAERGKKQADLLLEEVRGSPVVNADETGWREDGVNGYLWSVSTPEARYFYRDQSRASRVIQELLSNRFKGVLVCDFYSAYNWYLGPIQRCWVHLRRDLKKLAEDHSEDAAVKRWVDAVLTLYQDAKALVRRKVKDENERRRWRCLFEKRALTLAEPYLKAKDAPQQTLAKRLQRFQAELFTFVQIPGVPSGNNAAERAIRPAVISRKVCGGTRSARGSLTKTTLLTLFGTWSLHKRNLFEACVAMLCGGSVATQIAAS